MVIAIVDYGIGNVNSIKNMFSSLAIESDITSNPKYLLKADKIVLPGIGRFDTAVEHLNSRMNLRETLLQATSIYKIPILGICLGMQLLAESSEEGALPGLGLIAGKVVKFSNTARHRVPHMGWNKLKVLSDNLLLEGVEEDHRFYFSHSYYFQPEDSQTAIAATDYGLNFTSVINHGNVFGVQFHPEKSHQFGRNILKNFSRFAS